MSFRKHGTPDGRVIGADETYKTVAQQREALKRNIDDILAEHEDDKAAQQVRPE